MRLPFRSSNDRRAREADERARRAQDYAKQAREALRKAALDARDAALIARKATLDARDAARLLQAPAQRAGTRALDAGAAAWEHRDDAISTLRRAGRAAASAGRDATAVARQRIESLPPVRKRREPPRRRRFRTFLGIAAVAAAAAAAVAAARRSGDVGDRIRSAPDAAKQAPGRTRDIAESAVHRARDLAGSATTRARSIGGHGEQGEGAESENGGILSSLTSLPRSIRGRFRDSIDEGKEEARATEQELRERLDATHKNGD